MKKNKTFIVIGNSAAGISCIEAIRETDLESNIINISREPHRPYSRCILSYYLAGSVKKDRLWIRRDDFYKDLNVEPILGVEATAIDEKNKTVKLSNKNTLEYDALCLATGGSPKRPVLKGIEKKGVFYLRTIEDAEGILSMLKDVKQVVVLGGGLIGMRAAYSLSKQGKKVTVLVKSSHIFSQMLDYESADIMKMTLESNGIEIATGAEAVEILGKDTVEGVLTDDANKLACQLVIIGKGVAPNMDLVKGRLTTNEAVLVDKSLRTSNASIYAAGDVAETFDVFEQKTAINAIWPAGIKQGRIAGLNMAGENSIYEGSYAMNSVEFFGTSSISFGIIRPKKDGFEEIIQSNPSENIYRKVVLKDNKIVGAVLVNDIEKHGIILNLALQKIDISDIKDILADEFLDFAKIMPLIKRQPEKFKQDEYTDTSITYMPIL